MAGETIYSYVKVQGKLQGEIRYNILTSNMLIITEQQY